MAASASAVIFPFPNAWGLYYDVATNIILLCNLVSIRNTAPGAKMTQGSEASLDLGALMKWERHFASILQINPFASQTYERDLRRLARVLQEEAGKSSHILTENRIGLVRHWMKAFAPGARQAPPLWQGLAFGLMRFVLDPQLEGPLLSETKLPKIWAELDQLGREYEVPEHRHLLGIAERARLATRMLEKLRGTSYWAKQLKSHIWSACFGADLRKLLVYEPLLHEHNVLILGPTGSGKELVAQVLLSAAPGEWLEKKESLDWSGHRTEALNLAEFPRDLMAAQIVGYKRGSYTGAVQDFEGVLSRCHRGVVFLDEVGELPMEGQVVLLRALETKRVRPLGAASTEAADSRVIAATHSQLDRPEECPEFRRDLFYRLAGHIIRVPPLAQRTDDLLPIALGFLDSWGVKQQASLHLEDPRHKLTQWLEKEEIQSYTWPGNVRELKRMAAQVLLGEELSLPLTGPQESQTPAQVHTRRAPASPTAITHHPEIPNALIDGQWSMEDMRLWYIQHVLKLTGGRQKEASERLNIHRTTIYHAIKKTNSEDQS